MFSALALACCLQGQTVSEQPAINWAPTYAQAIQQATDNNRLILVEFVGNMDLGGFTKRLEQSTFSDPGVVKEINRFVPVKINGDLEGVDLAKSFGVTGYPTIVFLDKEGQVVGEIVGLLFPTEFISHVENVIDAHLNFDIYQKRYGRDNSDAFANEKLAAIYAEKGMLDPALFFLGKSLKLDPANKKGSLARALNAVGDLYMDRSTQRGANVAASYFLRATQCATDKAEIYYASSRLAQCDLAMNKPSDALKVLNQALAIKGLSADEQGQLQSMIDTANEEISH